MVIKKHLEARNNHKNSLNGTDNLSDIEIKENESAKLKKSIKKRKRETNIGEEEIAQKNSKKQQCAPKDAVSISENIKLNCESVNISEITPNFKEKVLITKTLKLDDVIDFQEVKLRKSKKSVINNSLDPPSLLKLVNSKNNKAQYDIEEKSKIFNESSNFSDKNSNENEKKNKEISTDLSEISNNDERENKYNNLSKTLFTSWTETKTPSKIDKSMLNNSTKDCDLSKTKMASWTDNDDTITEANDFNSLLNTSTKSDVVSFNPCRHKRLSGVGHIMSHIAAEESPFNYVTKRRRSRIRHRKRKSEECVKEEIKLDHNFRPPKSIAAPKIHKKFNDFDDEIFTENDETDLTDSSSNFSHSTPCIVHTKMSIIPEENSLNLDGEVEVLNEPPNINDKIVFKVC